MIRQSGRSASFTPLLRYLAVAAAAAVLTLAALTLGNAPSAAGLHLTGATDVTASSGRFPVASAVMFLRPRSSDGDDAPGGVQPDDPPSDNPGSADDGTTSTRTMDDLKKSGWTCTWVPSSGGYWECTKPGEKPYTCSSPQYCEQLLVVQSHIDEAPRPTQAV